MMEGDIDVDIARWILEFLVRQPLEDRILNSLIAILPLTDENLSIKKSLLLRRIESEIAAGVVSEKLLDLLEQIEELDFRCKIREHSESLKAAYCAVAVACTLKFLDSKGVDDKYDYFHAVKRIWRGKVSKMVKAEEVGLLSEELRIWGDEIEAAVWDESIQLNLLKKSEGIDAIEAVRRYVMEEKENMGPSFLEIVAETLKNDDKLKGILEVMQVTDAPVAADSFHTRDVHQEMQRGKVLTRRKYAAFRKPRVAATGGMPRGARVTHTDASADELFNVPSTPEVNALQEALRSSSLDLKAAVNDPLPDALKFAETVVSGIASSDTAKIPAEQGDRGANTSVEGSRPVQSSGGNTSNACSEEQKDAHRQSFMARNSTARTMEWEDLFEETPDPPNIGERAHLSSPRNRAVPPLQIYEMNNLKKRRRIKRWSLLEEDTLRIGVETYGRGNWKVILNSYRDVFEDRTEVDLKDKWRNMTK